MSLNQIVFVFAVWLKLVNTIRAQFYGTRNSEFVDLTLQLRKLHFGGGGDLLICLLWLQELPLPLAL